MSKLFTENKGNLGDHESQVNRFLAEKGQTVPIAIGSAEASPDDIEEVPLKTGSIGDKGRSVESIEAQLEIGKLQPLYDLFGQLSDSSQDQIIKAISAKVQSGEPMSRILATTLHLVESYNELDQPDDETGEVKDQARKIVEGMLEKFVEINKHKKQQPAEINQTENGESDTLKKDSSADNHGWIN